MPDSVVAKMPTRNEDGEYVSWLTTVEAAEYVRLSRKTLERMRSERRGPPWWRVSDSKTSPILYRKDELDIWLMRRMDRIPGEYEKRTD